MAGWALPAMQWGLHSNGVRLDSSLGKKDQLGARVNENARIASIDDRFEAPAALSPDESARTARYELVGPYTRLLGEIVRFFAGWNPARETDPHSTEAHRGR